MKNGAGSCGAGSGDNRIRSERGAVILPSTLRSHVLETEKSFSMGSSGQRREHLP